MSDHLTVTSGENRQEVIASAKVSQLKDISSTVKLLALSIGDPRFSFKAGQWVDMFIPGVDTVGGFSMCSAPDLLSSSGIIHLAIKFSKHPPAFWIHSKCKIGDEVQLRAGGSFCYDPSRSDGQRDLLLIAGGVGINPLYSILLHFRCLNQRISEIGSNGDNDATTPRQRKATMLYCARTVEELLFRDEMRSMTEASPNIRLKLHSTREKPSKDSDVTYGRIQEDNISEAVKVMDPLKSEAFICGPLPFITAMESFCIRCGMDRKNIHFERWW